MQYKPLRDKPPCKRIRQCTGVRAEMYMNEVHEYQSGNVSEAYILTLVNPSH